MISDWPQYSELLVFEKEERAVETIKEAVRGIRNIRAEMNVAPSKKAKVFVVSRKNASRRHPFFSLQKITVS